MKEYSIGELTLMSTKSAKSIPVARKIRPLNQTRMVAANPPPTDRRAEAIMDAQYFGKRKPALVLRFIWNGKFHRASLGPVRIQIHKTRDAGNLIPAEWTASIVVKGIVGRQRLSARDTTPGKAAYRLFSLPRWFFDGAQWRALTWVYRSVVMFGIASAHEPQGKYEVGLRSGANLHVPGIWVWQADSLRTLPKHDLVSTAPNRPNISRTPSMPDPRSSEGYIQEERGKPTMGYKFWTPQGWSRLSKKIVRAPQPKPYSQKNPNDHKVQGEAPGGVNIREWMEGKFDVLD